MRLKHFIVSTGGNSGLSRRAKLSIVQEVIALEVWWLLMNAQCVQPKWSRGPSSGPSKEDKCSCEFKRRKAGPCTATSCH